MARLRGRGAPPSPWDVLVTALADLPPGGSPVDALPALLAAVREATGCPSVTAWAAGGGRLTRLVTVPDELDPGTEEATAADTAALARAPGIAAVVPVMDADVERGAISITGDAVPPETLHRLRETAACAALLLRGPQLAAALGSRIEVADRLAIELAASRERLSSAEELQRRRTVAEIGAVSGGRMRDMRQRLRELRHGVDTVGSPPTASMDAMRATLEELIQQFRVMVRGIYPDVLRARGPRAALEELAADLACPVRFRGSLGERSPWEVESSLYWSTAAALRAMADAAPQLPVLIELERSAGRIRIRLQQPTADAADAVRAALDVSDDRLAAFGGGLTTFGGDALADDLTVDAWVPEGLLPVLWGPAGGAR